MIIRINSGNKNKIAEYKKYLDSNSYTLKFTSYDLEEPVSDHETVICYKASQFSEATLVDDVSLEVSGFNIGINVKNFIINNELKKEKYWGRNSLFTCYIGVRKENYAYLYKGSIEGKIVSPRGNSFGIAPFFLPKGRTKTLGEDMPPELNPRYLALQQFLNNEYSIKKSVIKKWNGAFQ